MIDLSMIQDRKNKQYWAALNDGKVVGLISMWAPDDVDYNEYSTRAQKTLALLGEVKEGELISRDKRSFIVVDNKNYYRGGITSGKYWSAIRDNKVVGLIPMWAPDDVDYEEYSSRAKRTLELLGEIKPGDILYRDGAQKFVLHGSHSRRKEKNQSEHNDKFWETSGFIKRISFYQFKGKRLYYADVGFIQGVRLKEGTTEKQWDINHCYVMIGDSLREWAENAIKTKASFDGKKMRFRLSNVKRIPDFYRGDKELQPCKIEALEALA